MGESSSAWESGVICQFIQIGVKEGRLLTLPCFSSLTLRAFREGTEAVRGRKLVFQGPLWVHPLVLPLSQALLKNKLPIFALT